jgi:tetratricopeptide (TPR) repeat protein
VQRAVTLFEEKKIEPALDEYRRGIRKDPLDEDTWYGLAETLHEIGRNKQALETYALALTFITHAPELRAAYAELLISNKRNADAMAVLQKGIEIDPENIGLKAALGTAALSALDDSSPSPTTTSAKAVAAKTEPAPTPAATGAATAAPGEVTAPTGDAKAAAPTAKKTTQVKRKKLCKLFCTVAKPK